MGQGIEAILPDRRDQMSVLRLEGKLPLPPRTGF